MLLAIHPTAAGWAYLGGGLTLASVPMVAALVVSHHVPDNVIAPLLAGLSFAAVVNVSVDIYGHGYALGYVPGSVWLAAASEGIWMLLFLPFALVLLFFPDGRLPSARWRVVPPALVVVVVVFQVGVALSPHAYIEPWQDTRHPESPVLYVVGQAMLPPFLLLLGACVASVFGRFRRAGPVQRQQLRWLLLAGATVPLTLLVSWTASFVLSGSNLVFLAVGVIVLATFVAVPTAVTIAITRHDAYDVDRAVVATTVFGIIGAWLLAMFTAVSTLAGLLADRASTTLAVVTTAVLALLLGGWRGRLVTAVDARLYPARARAIGAVSTLRAQVNAGTASPEQLEPVLREALRDPGLRVAYAVPGRTTCIDRDRSEVDGGANAVPTRMAGHPVGIIVPGSDTPPWLAEEVAKSAALLVEMGRLRLEVSLALQEVEASRARLVRAGYEERRRLELDLHDGAQQRLVSLGMALRLAQRHLGEDSTDLDEVFDGAVAEIGTAVSELRQIAHGLRPSSLDDGLAAALQNLTRNTPLPVVLDLCDGELPDHISTTAYYVASEAVANTVKHADAHSIAMSVHHWDGMVRVEVCDDGRGGATVHAGSGLAGLRDRVGALGGTLGIRSPVGAGTVIEAMLPCES